MMGPDIKPVENHCPRGLHIDHSQLLSLDHVTWRHREAGRRSQVQILNHVCLSVQSLHLSLLVSRQASSGFPHHPKHVQQVNLPAGDTRLYIWSRGAVLWLSTAPYVVSQRNWDGSNASKISYGYR